MLRSVARVSLVLSSLGIVPGVAAADVLDVEDEVGGRACTVAHQSSAGARCVECTVGGGGDRSCAGPTDGMDRRCAVGATRQVWCAGPRPGAEGPAGVGARWPYLVGTCACIGLGLIALVGAGLWRRRRRRAPE